jgi:hypothetical protein
MLFLRIAIGVLAACIVRNSYIVGSAVGSKQHSRSPSAEAPSPFTQNEQGAIEEKARSLVNSVTLLTREPRPGLETAKEIFTENIDLPGISMKLCGTVSEALIDVVCLYLYRLVGTDVVKKVQGYELGRGMRVARIAAGTRAAGRLEKDGSEPIPVTIIFNSEMKVAEVEVAGVPLIGGIRAVLTKYFDASGIRINEIKDPTERAKKCVDGIAASIE